MRDAVSRRLRVVVLLERRERCLVAAGDAEGAVLHHPLGVGHVADHFLDRPLVGRVAGLGLGLGQAAVPGHRLVELSRHGLGEVVDILDEADVAIEPAGVFGGCGSACHGAV